jgi:hypothetical protein
MLLSTFGWLDHHLGCCHDVPSTACPCELVDNECHSAESKASGAAGPQSCQLALLGMGQVQGLCQEGAVPEGQAGNNAGDVHEGIKNSRFEKSEGPFGLPSLDPMIRLQWQTQQFMHVLQQMMHMHKMIEMLQEQNRTLNTEKSNSLKMTHLLLFRALFSDNSCCKACA